MGVVLIAAFADKAAQCESVRFVCALTFPLIAVGFCLAWHAGYTMKELVALYEEGVFIAYAVIVGLVTLAMYALSKYIENIYAVHGAWSNQYAKYKKVCNLLFLCDLVWPAFSCLELRSSKLS